MGCKDTKEGTNEGTNEALMCKTLRVCRSRNGLHCMNSGVANNEATKAGKLPSLQLTSSNIDMLQCLDQYFRIGYTCSCMHR